VPWKETSIEELANSLSIKVSKLRIALSSDEKIPLAHIKHIYETCKWGWPTDTLAQKALANSYIGIVAYDEQTPVGFTRVISDGVAYALIVDTMVIPSHRKCGAGTLIVKAALDYLKKSGVGFAKLISSKEGKKLYETLGFEARPSDEPGMVMSLRDP